MNTLLIIFLYGLAVLAAAFLTRRVTREQYARHTRLIVQNLPVIVTAIDEQRRVVIWNREAERITGYSADEIIHHSDVLEQVYPDAHGSFRDLEAAVTAKDGSERVIAWSNVSAQHPISGWRSWAIGVDITDRERLEQALDEVRESLEQANAQRTAELYAGNAQLEQEVMERQRAVAALGRSENQLRSTLDALSDYVHVVDKNLAITLVNKAFLALNQELGLETQPLGRTPRELIPILSPQLEDEYRQVFETGQMRTTEDTTQLGDLKIVTETRKIPLVEAGEVTHVVTVMRDITEQRAAEDLLRQTQFSLDHAPVNVFWIDEDARLLYVNETACVKLGYTRDELLAMTVADVDPRFRTESWANHWANLKTQDHLLFESRQCTRDGREFPTEVVTTFLTYGSQQFICAFVRDITHRKQAEKVLRQSEERFKQLYENAPLGYQSLDKDGYFIDINQTWLDVLGYDREDVIGRWFGDFLAPDYQDHFRHNFPCFLAEGQVRGIEFEMVCNSGAVIVVSLDGRIAYDARGEIVQTHCILSDITERKRVEMELRASEERFRVLVDSMDDVIFTLDSDQRHTGVFGRWIEKLGMAPDMFLGRTSRDIFGREAAAVHEAANARALVGEHAVYEWTMPTPDGELRTYQTSLSPMFDPQGRVTGLAGIGRDITALKQAEQAAIRLAVERERAQILTDFIRDTSHEFANPLSVIKNSAYLALHIPDPAQRQRHLEMINGQVFHIERLVEGMILMSRLDAGIAFRRAPIYLDAILDAIRTRLRKAIEDSAQTLLIDLQPDLPPLTGDQTYLHMAILNLVENAMQYTPPGGTIAVRAAESTSERDQLVITVADTGVGIAEEYHERIFERFFRVDRARTERGAGLGLPIAHAIITRHGGTITLESAPGEGSIFRIFLPIAGS